MDRNDIADLLEYDRWATQRQLAAAAALGEAKIKSDLGPPFGSLYGTLVHLYAVQRLWLDRWKGNSPKSVIPASQIPTLADLQPRWEAYHVEVEDFIRFMNDDNMKEKFSYLDFQGTFCEQPLYLQMLNAVVHSIHHRGQAAVMLRKLGAQPPDVGFATFLAERK